MRQVLLQTSDIGSLRDRADNTDVTPFLEVRPSGITLPALLELVCSSCTRPLSAGDRFEAIVGARSQYLPDLRHARQLLATGAGSQSESFMFDAPRKEFWSIQCRTDWTNDSASLFQSRFRRSLEKQGFGKKLSLALSKAMQEMADKVVQHSGS